MHIKDIEKIYPIHDSLINGQRKQMVKQIDEYGFEFFEDYYKFLDEMYYTDSVLKYFKDATVSYMNIKNR